MVMNLFEVQLVALFILLIGTFLCGILPVLCFRCLNCFSSNTSSRVTSILIFFGGGVLFATSMLHLLPEARENLEHVSFHGSEKSHTYDSSDLSSSFVKESHASETTTTTALIFQNNSSHHHPQDHKHGFAVTEFLALCGFFATYLIEEIIRSILKKRSSDLAKANRVKFCSCAQRNTECSRTYKDLKLDKADLLAPDFEKRKRSSTWAGQDNRGEGACANVPSEHAPPPPDLLRSSILSQAYPKYGAVEEGGAGLPMRVDGGITLVNRPVAVQAPPDLPEIIVVPPSSTPELTSTASISIGSLLTVAALSFHSVFEGFAVGFQSTISGTWTLSFAVALHKFVIAFVISVEAVAEGNSSAFVLACMAVFSAMSPLGMAVAMSLAGSGANNSSSSPLVVGIVNCIATGTLLYVTFFEILRRKGNNLCGGQKLLATSAGFLLMSALQYLTAEF